MADRPRQPEAFSEDERWRQSMLSVAAGTATHPRDVHWFDASVPCRAACPARTDIPAYLDAIARGRYDAAYRINLRDNVFPGVLGRVCTRPCEPACRHGHGTLGEPVAICASKRAAADHLPPQSPVRLTPSFPPTGKQVAVVGAGPAGLAAARDLALAGHAVVVYEREPEPGGLMILGIPRFRLPRAIVTREIGQITLTGVRILCGREVGRDLPLAALLAEHDAVLLATGADKTNRPDTPGLDLAGIWHGLDFLRETNLGCPPAVGKRVLVIGGGFTASDCARTATHLGASSVRILYRRSEAEMYLHAAEVAAMAEEGITLETCVTPVAFSGSVNQSITVRLARTRLLETGTPGRRAFEIIPGSEFATEADTVLLATGQSPDTSWMTGEDLASPKLFLAGDFAGGSASMIEAVAGGRDAARRMDAFLTGRQRFSEILRVETVYRTGRTREMDELPRHAAPVIPVAVRDLDTEVERGFDRPAAEREARRCYLCHYKFEIDNEYCIYCDRCLKAKPLERCIVKIERLIHDEQDRVVGVDPWKGQGPYRLYIDPALCIRCGLCRQTCPMSCISLQKVTPGLVLTSGNGSPSVPP